MRRNRQVRRYGLVRRYRLAFATTAAAIAAAAGLAAAPSAAASGASGAASSASASPIYLNPAYTPGERAADLVGRMTTEQKAQQMDSSRAPAIPDLGVAAWGWWNESNHGVNASTLTPSGNATTLVNTTSYPTDLAMGSTWNQSLVYSEARQIGAEAREVQPGNTQNMDFYAPTVNLARDPRWGRDDESWSEDPLLTGALAGQYVDGVQGETPSGQLPPSAKGTYQAIATLKHYAANNNEDTRLSGDSEMDAASLRQYYTQQFTDIISSAHPGSIMSSYNEVNGTPSPASVQLNQEMARETYGFGGYFTSDCDAVYVMQHYHNWTPPNAAAPVDQYTRSAYANSAGEDLECNAGYQDGNNYGNSIPTALTQNVKTQTDTFNIGDVDTSLIRLFTARIETGEFDAESTVPWVQQARAELGGKTWTNSSANDAVTETPARLAQAQASADQSLVMLKNSAPSGSSGSAGKNPLLPLNIPHHGPYKLAVVGYFAHPQSLFLGGYSSIQSGQGAANNVDSYEGIKAAVQKIDPDATVDFLPGVTGGTTAASLTTVDSGSIAAAKNYNAVVAVAGTDSSTGSEGKDRGTLALPGAQSQMISQLEAANPDTIVYLETMGTVDTSPFAGATPALLWSSYNGQRQGAALADVLTGKTSPSGHLPFTWYADQSQLPAGTDYHLQPSATSHGWTYMYFNGGVAWPFGYGLSYAKFRYSGLHADQSSVDANGTETVTASVTNTGSADGYAVPQLYATTPGASPSAQVPKKRLEGFQKIYLGPGQTRRVTFTVKVPDLAFYSDSANKLVAYDGTVGLQLGSSSSDIAQQVPVRVTGGLNALPSAVTVQPVSPSDAADDVAQRAYFPVGATIRPNLTVSLTDQSLAGYVTKGKSAPLPTGMTVRYSSDRPGTVAAGPDGTLKAVGTGPATITATVTYKGKTVTGTAVVDVTG